MKDAPGKEKKLPPWMDKGAKKFNKGGEVKKYAKGGMVRSGGHGDGCAQRGRTKGRMV